MPAPKNARLTDRREQLLDVIGESDSCNDDECGCHRAAWDARDELGELDDALTDYIAEEHRRVALEMPLGAAIEDSHPDTRAADALAIVSEGLFG